jgi:hypothetical protein
MFDRIHWEVKEFPPSPAIIKRVAPKLSHQLLAEIPVMPADLAKWTTVLPFKSKFVVIDTGVKLAESLRRINRDSQVIEIDRGPAFLPKELTNFGQAVDIMEFTRKQHGLTRVGTHSVGPLVAGSRSITAWLAVEDGKMELNFSIYRQFVSLLDYVQVAVPLPGLDRLELRPHPRLKEILFLTEV